MRETQIKSVMKSFLASLLLVAAIGSAAHAWSVSSVSDWNSIDTRTYMIRCDNGSDGIVTESRANTYLPFYSRGDSFHTLGEAASRACR